MAKTILLAKYTPGEALDLREIDTRAGAYLTELRNTGYLDFVPSEQPTCEPGFHAVESLEVIDGCIVQSWTVTPDDEKSDVE